MIELSLEKFWKVMSWNYVPEPQPSPIAEKLEDVSTNEQIRQKSGRVELDEDFERERFRLLNLLTETIKRKQNPRFLLPVTPKMHQTKRVWVNF